MKKNKLTEAEQIRSLIDALTDSVTFNEKEILEEACGVGGFAYKKQIEYIIRWASNNLYAQIKNDMDNGSYKSGKIYKAKTGILPKNYIDFINNLEIEFSFQENGYTDKYGTHIDQFPNNQLVDGKLDKVLIYSYCNFDPNTLQLEQEAMYGNLYHELNHAYETYCQLISMQNTKKYVAQLPDFSNLSTTHIDQQTIKEKYLDKCAPDFDFKADYLKNCCYALFSNTELNAHVAGVYGNVHGIMLDYESKTKMKIDRNNYASNVESILKMTETYKTYNYFKSNYNAFFNNLTQNEANNIIAFLNQYCIRIPTRGNSITILKNLIKDRINRFYYRICRAASLAVSELIDEYNKQQANNK